MTERQRQIRLRRVRRRLEKYLAMEESILENERVRDYGIGTRSAKRDEIPLPDLQRAIKALQDEETQLMRGCGLAARAVVPTDW